MLYVNTPLDRAQALRRDAGSLRHLLAHPDLRLLPMWGELSLLTSPPCMAVQLGGAAARQILQQDCRQVFLGLDGVGRPFFAADLPDRVVPDAGPGEWHHLRGMADSLPPDDAALLGCARALLGWQKRTLFCGSCGAPTRSSEGGHVMVCSNPECGVSHYPRTDPAVIMLVEDEDRVLLHRQPGWAPGMWSILAGFVEPGEGLEEAVRREVTEETGIQVDDIRYVASQPWPYPFSMMIGYTARAVGGTLRHDPHELEEARWFSRAEIVRDFREEHRQTGQGPYMPRLGSLSNHMLCRWLERR